MEILLIGSADSIFFEHYCKNLKLQKPDIKIDIFYVMFKKNAIRGTYQ